jgi:hypothetical protein
MRRNSMTIRKTVTEVRDDNRSLGPHNRRASLECGHEIKFDSWSNLADTKIGDKLRCRDCEAVKRGQSKPILVWSYNRYGCTIEPNVFAGETEQFYIELNGRKTKKSSTYCRYFPTIEECMAHALDCAQRHAKSAKTAYEESLESLKNVEALSPQSVLERERKAKRYMHDEKYLSALETALMAYTAERKEQVCAPQMKS